MTALNRPERFNRYVCPHIAWIQLVDMLSSSLLH